MLTKNIIKICTNPRFGASILLALLLPQILLAPAFANLVGTATETFNPTTNGLDFITVQSSETLKPGYFNLGLFVDYEVNSLPYYGTSPQGLADFNDTLFNSDLNVGVGLIKDLDVGFSAPFLLKQTINADSGYRGEFGVTGNTEFRFNTKYHLWNNDRWGVAVIGSVNFNRILNDPYAGQGAGPTYNLELAADTTVHDVKIGFNLGHRFRSPGTPVPTFPVDPLRDALIFSMAASYWISSIDSRIIGELFGQAPTQSRSSDLDRNHDDLEALVGVKHALRDDLALHAGISTKIINGVGAPDWRIYTGLNYTFGPVFNRQATEAPEVRIEPSNQETLVFRNIHFMYDSDEMVGDYVDVLNEFEQFLKKSPDYSHFTNITIEGHTDSLGRAAYNQKLSERRANAIKKYLIAHFNIPASKLTAIGYGASRPIADNGNYQGRQTNRRVEFKITK